MTDSDVIVSGEYRIKMATPVVIPNGGIFVEMAQVDITSAVSKAEIHFVIASEDDDIFDPGPESRTFQDTFQLTTTHTIIRAFAQHPDMEDSDVVESAVFTIEAAPPRSILRAGPSQTRRR